MGKKELRVVLDTNVLVSALLFGGSLQEIYKAWKEGKLILIFTEETLEEFVKVLHYPKFGLSEEEINYLLYIEVLPYSEVVEKRYNLSEDVCSDKDDIKFLECALSGKADFIVSGDKDLLSVKKFKKLKILKPSDFKKLNLSSI